MRKNADNLKISHRQLLSLALQGVPFALINVFHKKKPTINISINCIDTSSFQLLRLSHLSLSPRQNPLRLTAITENFLPQRFSIFHQKSTQRSGYDPYFRCFLFGDSCWSLGRLTKSLPEPELYVRFSSLRIWFPWKNTVLIREALSFVFIWKTTQIFLLYPLNRVILCYLSHQNTQYLICGKHILI